MYLSRLIIRNYRSIKNIDLAFKAGKNVIVGRNNSGKSNIVKALDIVLGENSPTYNKSENITQGDFYSWKEGGGSGELGIKSADRIEIICKLTREDGESLDFNEINNCFGYYKVLESMNYREGPSADVDKTFNLGEELKSESLDPVFVLDKDETDTTSPAYIKAKRWIDSKLSNQRKFKDELENMYEFLYVFRAWKDEGVIKKDMRFLYRENELEEWVVGLTAPVRNELLQSAIIASFRDPQNQLRLTNYTWYGKLMRALTMGHSYQDDLKNAHVQIKAVADKIFETAKNNIQKSSINVAFPNTEIFFQFNEDLKTDIYKDCKIYVDDGVKSPLQEKGSGIQSATIIGLFSYYINNYGSKTGALLCVEEPELYLHPHARRVVSDRLDDFLGDDKNQVIITTHSSEFIKTTQENLNIILVKNSTNQTTAKSVDIREYRSLLLDGNQNELFFADKVIICEGYDSYILRWAASEKFPEKIDGGNISIITAGGKDAIIKLAELIIKLGIKCFIFTDFDFFLRDSSEDADKYKEEKKDPVSGKIVRIKSFRHKSIVDLPSGFFEQECILGDDSTRTLAEIKALRSEIKSADEKYFFTGKSANESSIKKSELMNILSNLRAKGLGVLNEEIEDLSKDDLFLSSHNKLDLNKIFAISSKINDENKSIEDIFEIDQIQSFLGRVIES